MRVVFRFSPAKSIHLSFGLGVDLLDVGGKIFTPNFGRFTPNFASFFPNFSRFTPNFAAFIPNSLFPRFGTSYFYPE